MTFGALVILTSLAAASGALAQDAAAGKTSFNKCLACHAIGEGAKNKVGPVLNGLDGRQSGSAEGYNYSDANKNSGITWGKEVFLEYIKDPKAKIPGTKMVFAGIKTEKEANDLWAYVSRSTRTASEVTPVAEAPCGVYARQWRGLREWFGPRRVRHRRPDRRLAGRRSKPELDFEGLARYRAFRSARHEGRRRRRPDSARGRFPACSGCIPAGKTA